MPAGRPTDYNPDFCALIIEHGEKGASVVEMAYECGVTKQSIYEWARVHPEFSDALNKARAASQVWWERKGRAGIEKSSSEFQGNLWGRNMSARFPEDWREIKGTELTGANGGPVEHAVTHITRTIVDPAAE